MGESSEELRRELAEIRARLRVIEDVVGIEQASVPATEPPATSLRMPRSTAGDEAPASAPLHRALTASFWTGTRLLALLGGLLVVVGAVFLVTLAIGNGWITPAMQVAFATGGGVLLALAGVRVHRPGDDLRRPLAQTLAGCGGAVSFLGVVAGTRLYDLLPTGAGLSLAAAIAAVLVVLAWRWQAELVAVFGITGAVSAPLLVDAPASLGTVAFTAVMLAGSAALIALQGWPWLVHAALWPSFVEASIYLDRAHHRPAHALAAGGWWLLAGGGALAFDLRRPAGRLRTSTALATLLVGALSCWLALFGLGHGRTPAGSYTLGLGVAYGALAGGVLLARRTRMTAIWLMTIGSAFAAAGATVLLGGGRLTEIGAVWAIEALALLWLARHENDRVALAGSALAGTGATVVLLWAAPPSALIYGASSIGRFAAAALILTAAWTAVLAFRPEVAVVPALTALYALSGLIVTAVAGERPPGSHTIDQHAQVTLSLVWVGIGLVLIAAALARRSSLLRRGGMGLLVLAAAKALLLDLAALAAGARVLALVGVGLVLFAASYLLARFERDRA